MAEVGRIENLREEHARLHAVIEEEEGRLAPDSVLLTQLKRKKLRIKDQISQIDAH